MPQTTTRRDTERMTVFLSHSTKDGAFVEKLAIALEASGFAPWRCEVDIETGANFVAKINDGLAQADVALLVWSPEAAASRWTEQEWTSLLARQVEDDTKFCAVPGGLGIQHDAFPRLAACHKRSRRGPRAGFVPRFALRIAAQESIDGTKDARSANDRVPQSGTKERSPALQRWVGDGNEMGVP
jgi:TIR domain